MALVEMQNRGLLKNLVTLNFDGLHRKSGIDPAIMIEFYGNTNMEVCSACGREYLREYRVRTAKTNTDHRTGRQCDTPSCRCALLDTTTSAGEQIAPDLLARGLAATGLSDLMIVLGTTMPNDQAYALPFEGRLVMINVEKSRVDGECKLIIREDPDKVMSLLMQKLNLS